MAFPKLFEMGPIPSYIVFSYALTYIPEKDRGLLI